MSKLIPHTEVFYSVQGEGVYVGVPTVFIRLFGCNFTCQGFSNHDEQGSIGDIPIKVVDSIDQLKGGDFQLGCDSRYSWHKDYRHLAEKCTAQDLAKKIIGVLPSAATGFELGGMPIHICITGGEPTMHQDAIVDILHELDEACKDEWGYMTDSRFCPQRITIETNCSLPLKKRFATLMGAWLSSSDTRELLWSNSPKLSHSGEPRERAINPKVFHQQLEISPMASFKFVVRPDEYDFIEVEQALDEYFLGSGTTPRDLQLRCYVMPVGATSEQQAMVQRKVADLAMAYGYSYSPRLHCDLFGNELNT
ncbi:radical SAM domain-containing protein [Vibrio phage vB_VcorM_GR11A]|nr:radical SAM domain-containing protein [Vibrio phage vB_VcorM_GR11A]